MAKANETLAAQMKVALAVEQGPEEGTDSNKSSASPTEAVTEPSDTSSGLTGEQKGKTTSKATLEPNVIKPACKLSFMQVECQASIRVNFCRFGRRVTSVHFKI